MTGLPAVAGAQAPPPTTAPIPPPDAFVVVDGGTGAVLLASNDHVPRPPASISKLITALVVASRLRPDTPIHVTADAAAMPARKLNIQPGQTWRAGDLLRAMLLCSCNDVARALADSAGGSVGGFGVLARAEAKKLGLRDSPVIQDPAGLDDNFSVGGGNRVSAYDMAIVARAFLANPTLAAIVRLSSYQWLGPDGKEHSVHSENRLFGTYPGAIGVKTGYTDKARATFVAAARRGGRTIIVVIMGSADIWYHAPELLDYGFATKVTASMVRLPAVPGAAAVNGGSASSPTVPVSTAAGGGSLAPAPTIEPAGAKATHRGRSHGGVLWVLVGVLAALVLVAIALGRRRVARRRAASRARTREAALAALARD